MKYIFFFCHISHSRSSVQLKDINEYPFWYWLALPFSLQGISPTEPRKSCPSQHREYNTGAPPCLSSTHLWKSPVQLGSYSLISQMQNWCATKRLELYLTAAQSWASGWEPKHSLQSADYDQLLLGTAACLSLSFHYLARYLQFRHLSHMRSI